MCMHVYDSRETSPPFMMIDYPRVTFGNGGRIGPIVPILKGQIDIEKEE